MFLLVAGHCFLSMAPVITLGHVWDGFSVEFDLFLDKGHCKLTHIKRGKRGSKLLSDYLMVLFVSSRKWLPCIGILEQFICTMIHQFWFPQLVLPSVAGFCCFDQVSLIDTQKAERALTLYIWCVLLRSYIMKVYLRTESCSQVYLV